MDFPWFQAGRVKPERDFPLLCEGLMQGMTPISLEKGNSRREFQEKEKSGRTERGRIDETPRLAMEEGAQEASADQQESHQDNLSTPEFDNTSQGTRNRNYPFTSKILLLDYAHMDSQSHKSEEKFYRNL